MSLLLIKEVLNKLCIFCEKKYFMNQYTNAVCRHLLQPEILTKCPTHEGSMNGSVGRAAGSQCWKLGALPERSGFFAQALLIELLQSLSI